MNQSNKQMVDYNKSAYIDDRRQGHRKVDRQYVNTAYCPKQLANFHALKFTTNGNLNM